MSPPLSRRPGVIALFHHRWNVPLLVALHDAGGGARAIVLMNMLGVSRNPLRVALVALQEIDMVEANPGYGHPLRPEFLLTRRGRAVAPHGKRYLGVVADSELAALKWTAPLLSALAHCERFNELSNQLGVAPRPLAATLKALVVAELIERRVDDGHPPRSSYYLTERGREAATALDDLARAFKT